MHLNFSERQSEPFSKKKDFKLPDRESIGNQSRNTIRKMDSEPAVYEDTKVMHSVLHKKNAASVDSRRSNYSPYRSTGSVDM